MTKKIPCRVIDSTPLCEGENLMHIGWSLDCSLYKLRNLSAFAGKKSPDTFKTQAETKPFETSLNCYA